MNGDKPHLIALRTRTTRRSWWHYLLPNLSELLAQQRENLNLEKGILKAYRSINGPRSRARYHPGLVELSTWQATTRHTPDK